MKLIPDEENIHAQWIKNKDERMNAALAHIIEAMEILGNAIDEPCALDVYVTTPAFNIIVHGHDDVEGDFENIDK